MSFFEFSYFLSIFSEVNCYVFNGGINMPFTTKVLVLLIIFQAKNKNEACKNSYAPIWPYFK